MTTTIEQTLQRMGVVLPQAAAPAAAYLPWVRSGNLLFVAGQLPLAGGKLISTGLLGRNLDVAAGQAAARQCAVNVLAQVKAATGDLEAIARIVKLTAYVASTPDFTQQHLVANGASEFVAEALGDRGLHARVAVGTASLPLDAPVEIEAVVELK